MYSLTTLCVSRSVFIQHPPPCFDFSTLLACGQTNGTPTEEEGTSDRCALLDLFARCLDPTTSSTTSISTTSSAQFKSHCFRGAPSRAPSRCRGGRMRCGMRTSASSVKVRRGCSASARRCDSACRGPDMSNGARPGRRATRLWLTPPGFTPPGPTTCHHVATVPPAARIIAVKRAGSRIIRRPGPRFAQPTVARTPGSARRVSIPPEARRRVLLPFSNCIRVAGKPVVAGPSGRAGPANHLHQAGLLSAHGLWSSLWKPALAEGACSSPPHGVLHSVERLLGTPFTFPNSSGDW